MKQYLATRRLKDYLLYLVTLVLVLAPFHAFLTVWLHSVVGHYTTLRLWSVGLLLISSIIAVLLLLKDKVLRSRVINSPIIWIIAAYILLHLGLGLWAIAHHNVTGTALGYSLVSNLRYLVFFVLCLIVGATSKPMHWRWISVLLIPGMIVIVFGLLQHYVLTYNFLNHFGYSPQTIAAYQTVDQNINYIRLQSTLRGSNPLGAYLVIVIAAIVTLFLVGKQKFRKILGLFLIAALIVLFYTYSRSAWLAAILTSGIIVYLLISSRLKVIVSVLGLVLVGLSVVAFVTLRHNLVFENTVFHTSTLSRSRHSSNQNHESAVLMGVKDIFREPFGRGPGTAGPASVYNGSHVPRVAENYYLQIGQEVGFVGLALFLVILLLLAFALWKLRADPLALVLLSSLVGISLINLFSHASGDDTLALVWWGLAGICTAPVILKTKAVLRHETQKTQKKAAF